MAYSDLFKLFKELDKVVEKGDLVLDLTTDNPLRIWSISYWGIHKTGEKIQRTKVYQFNGDISIAKEEYAERGTESQRVTGWPECRYESWPYSRNWSVFYVFKGNNLVSDEKEAREIIQKVTGVNLPKLDTRPDDFGADEDSYRVATEFSLDKKFEHVFASDEQPDEHDLSRGAYRLRRKVKTLPKALGLSKEQVIPNIFAIKEIITEYSEIYKKKYLEKDKSLRKVVEYMLERERRPSLGFLTGPKAPDTIEFTDEKPPKPEDVIDLT